MPSPLLDFPGMTDAPLRPPLPLQDWPQAAHLTQQMWMDEGWAPKKCPKDSQKISRRLSFHHKSGEAACPPHFWSRYGYTKPHFYGNIVFNNSWLPLLGVWNIILVYHHHHHHHHPVAFSTPRVDTVATSGRGERYQQLALPVPRPSPPWGKGLWGTALPGSRASEMVLGSCLGASWE